MTTDLLLNILSGFISGVLLFHYTKLPKKGKFNIILILLIILLLFVINGYNINKLISIYSNEVLSKDFVLRLSLAISIALLTFFVSVLILMSMLDKLMPEKTKNKKALANLDKDELIEKLLKYQKELQEAQENIIRLLEERQKN